MGRKKITPVPETAPKPKPKAKKCRVKFEQQWRDFDSQTEAREYAIKLLEAGVYFLEVNEVKVEK